VYAHRPALSIGQELAFARAEHFGYVALVAFLPVWIVDVRDQQAGRRQSLGVILATDDDILNRAKR
jgi:hypothetical protein